MIHPSNFKARQSLNNQYAQIKGASSINEVALGFGKGWIIFAILSSMASAFSFYQDFYQSLGAILSILIVVTLAVALEGFKHLSIKGMFSDMNLLSRSLISTIAMGLIAVSFYTHYKSIQTFQKNLVNSDLKNEIAYQRDLQRVQNGQINAILETNAELAKALNNGSKRDDKASSSSVQSNNQLITTLQKLSAQNNMSNTTLLLQQSKETAKTTASAILIIFIMVEIMALFSILSKIIIVDNVSGNVKEFFGLIDKLDELESNTYQSLGYQKIEQTKAKIKAIQNHQEEAYHESLAPMYHNEQNNKNRVTNKQMPTLNTLTSIGDNYLSSNYIKQEEPMPISIKPLGNQGVEPLSNTIQKHNEKLLDLTLYDEAEQLLLELLWNKGEIKIGENLLSRRLVLKEAGALKGKSGVLTNLYQKLLRNDSIAFNVRYVAKINFG